jgi:hypothetical protein
MEKHRKTKTGHILMAGRRYGKDTPVTGMHDGIGAVVVYADSRVAPFVWRSSELSVVRQRFDEQKKKPEYKVYVRTNK